MELPAERIVDGVARVYSNATSYQDVGFVETVLPIDGQLWSTKTIFRTIFQKPDLFRFDRRFQFPERETTSLVVCFDGKQGLYSDIDGGIKRIAGDEQDPDSKRKTLNELLLHGEIFARPISILTHRLLLTEASWGEPILTKNRWRCDFSDASHFKLLVTNGCLKIDRNYGTISEWEALSETYSTHAVFIDVRLNEQIDSRIFDARTIQSEIASGSILKAQHQALGQLCRPISNSA